jgi:hypothetical protein
VIYIRLLFLPVVQLVEVPWYKLEGMGSIPDGVGIFQ